MLNVLYHHAEFGGVWTSHAAGRSICNLACKYTPWVYCFLPNLVHINKEIYTVLYFYRHKMTYAERVWRAEARHHAKFCCRSTAIFRFLKITVYLMLVYFV